MLQQAVDIDTMELYINIDASVRVGSQRRAKCSKMDARKQRICVCVFVCGGGGGGGGIGGGGGGGERYIWQVLSSDRKEWTFVAKEAKALRATQNPESSKCCT